MAKTFGPRYYRPEGIDFKRHVALGDSWYLRGSRGDIYTVTMTPRGFTCNCPAMTYRGKCQHTFQVADKLEFII